MTGNGLSIKETTAQTITEILRIIPSDHVLSGEPMSAHTSFRIGGPAAALILCRSEEELASVLGICTSHPDAEYMLIGNGSNFLVSDDGYPGIMIKLCGEFDNISVEGDSEDGDVLVRAGAAKLLSGVSAFLTEHGLSGMEFASGIPGSIGGAVFMNAGAYGGEMKDVVVSVRLMKPDASEILELPACEMDFGYRHSMVEESGLIVLSVLLKLCKDDPAGIAARVHELQEKKYRYAD